jgi:hypothetical protein
MLSLVLDQKREKRVVAAVAVKTCWLLLSVAAQMYHIEELIAEVFGITMSF